MSVGKYSPTVSYSYRQDQQWFEKNGGGYGNGINPDVETDDEGYDSYGYSGKFGDGPDRAGFTEDQYLSGNFDEEGEFLGHFTYDRVSSEWSGVILGADRTHTYPKN